MSARLGHPRKALRLEYVRNVRECVQSALIAFLVSILILVNQERARGAVEDAAVLGAVPFIKNVVIDDLDFKPESNCSLSDSDESLLFQAVNEGVKHARIMVPCTKDSLSHWGRLIWVCCDIRGEEPSSRFDAMGARSAVILERDSDDGFRSECRMGGDSNSINEDICPFRKVERSLGKFCVARGGIRTFSGRLGQSSGEVYISPQVAKGNSCSIRLNSDSAKSDQGNRPCHYSGKSEEPIRPRSGAETFAKIVPPRLLRFVFSFTCLYFGGTLMWRGIYLGRYRSAWPSILGCVLAVVGFAYLFPAAR